MATRPPTPETRKPSAAGRRGRARVPLLVRVNKDLKILFPNGLWCGGITEFLRGSALAAAHNLQVSGHCAPNLHARVGAAVPNLRHVEYFHDHQRIEGMLFDGALDPAGGVMTPDPDEPGLGLTLREPDAERYRRA